MAVGSRSRALSALLFVLFFVELAGLFLPAALHEAAGVVFVAAAFWHACRNRWYWSGKPRGGAKLSRFLNTASIGILAAASLLLLVSGVGLSRTLFGWARLPDLLNWRSLHLGCAVVALASLFVHGLFNLRSSLPGWRMRAAVGAAFVVAAASVFALPYMDRWMRPVEVDRAAVVAGDRAPLPGRVLTLYFSRVGNTDFPPDVAAVSGASLMRSGNELLGNAQMLALMIQDAAGGDIAALQTVKRYPASYPETTRIGRAEIDGNESVALAEGLPNLSDYDVIFAVYPVWWGTVPKALETALKGADLKGKVIVPVATHGGSGVAESVHRIAELTEARVLGEGFPVYSSDIPFERKAVGDFVKGVRAELETGK